MSLFQSKTFWRIFLMANIIWALQSAMFCVLMFNSDILNKAFFLALASLFHTRLIFLSGDKLKELDQKDRES